MYAYIIGNYIRKLSGLTMRQLSHSHIQQLLTDTQTHPRTCEQLLMTVKQILRAAARDHYINKDDLEDIITGLEKPAYRPRERRALTTSEKSAILLAPFTDRERTYIYLVYGCGLRREEALALTPFDVDLKKGQISITKAVAFDVNQPYIKETKNYRNRFVPMPSFLQDWLRAELKGQWPEYLVEKTRGGLMTKSAYDRMWEQIKRKIFDVKEKEAFETLSSYDLTSHYFRHNYCASLCYQVPKVSIKKIAQLMGDTEKMVLEVYNHIIEENEQVSAALADAIGL